MMYYFIDVSWWNNYQVDKKERKRSSVRKVEERMIMNEWMKSSDVIVLSM